MVVLVTGSNGFIGYHVSKYLHDHGHYVIGLGRRALARRGEVVDEYLQCNLSEDEVSEICNKISAVPEAVIHLAADMRKEPFCVEVINANCCGTQRLLEMCEREGIKVFAQLSSLPVIGKPIIHPITEDHPICPYSVYHITKRTEELLADYACTYHGIRTSSFRISAPIGIGMNPNTIFPTFVRKALDGEDLVLLGKGTRRQNYIYVKDIARCLALAIEKPTVKGVYNLTSDILLSNNELALLIVRMLKSDSKLVFQGKDYADDYVWDASNEKIRRDSGFHPSSCIEEMIAEYGAWLNKHIAND